jgi:2-keto-4-pentenoate hydratase/2-oxohepta-3-ene-1,7-dioic acid hydratase in catechol pathway
LRLPFVQSAGESSHELAPQKILCVGRNYRAHAAELGNQPPPEPLLFFKPPSSLIGSGAAIRRPAQHGRVDYEGELAVIIGSRGRRIRPKQALDHVLGVTCLNDVTCRELQKRDNQWTRAKGFDTFCPIGPRIVAGLDASDLAIETRLNGEVVQSARTSQMVFSIAEIIAYASAVMTLEPGDVIATGTPAGVGPLVPGDVVAVEIEGVGVLENPVEPDFAGRSAQSPAKSHNKDSADDEETP